MDYNSEIERYIEGLMGQDEVDAFRKKMAADPELSKLVDDTKRIQLTGEKMFSGSQSGDPADLTPAVEKIAGKDIKAYAERDGSHHSDPAVMAFSQQLGEAERKLSDNKRVSSKIITGKAWYFAAAVLIMVIGIPLLFILTAKQDNNRDIFQDYYISYVNSDQMMDLFRSGNDFALAVKVYESGDYERALRLMEPYLLSEEYAHFAEFYSGLSCMGLERYETAIDYFESVKNSGEKILFEPAGWYLGLCLLITDDTAAAIEQFEILAGSGTPISKKARKIVKKVRKAASFSYF